MRKDKRGERRVILSHPFLSILILFSLAACMPQRQIYREATGHPDITLRDDTLLAADGVELPLRSWLPEGAPKAVIIALHGFNDYSNAYMGAGLFFRAHGVAVFAYDQRGFGKTAYNGIWANEKNLVSDLAECVKQAARRYPGVPIYVLGESMGGAVALVAAADPSFPRVEGFILSAPAVWGAGTMSPVFRTVLWLTAHTIPTYTVTGSELKILASNNYPMLRRLASDPLVIKRTRIDTIYGVVHLMDLAYESVPRVQRPVLYLYGAQDQVIPRAPVESALQRFTEPVMLACYPDGYHMLFRDIQRQQVLGDMLSWIEHPQEPLPSGYGKLLAVK